MLDRFFAPGSVAVVGASERRMMSNAAVDQLLTSGVELHLVNPSVSHAYGRPTVPDLAAVGHPVDAVLAIVGADAAIDVVAQAAVAGCGGVVVVASGFAEAGPEGLRRQDRLRLASGGMPVLGPNCTGFANITRGVSLFTGMPVPVQQGSISILSQSGYLMRAAMVATRERGLGVNLAISSGNEAVTGLEDYLDFLASDAETRVICLVLETVRNAPRFFRAVERAHRNDKAVVALKLGTSERGRDITRSHTGAIATESWVYEVGLRQAGVITAVDLEDLLDRAMLLGQLRPHRWHAVRNVTVIASSGGVAALANDTATGDCAVALPPLERLLGAVRERIPGAPHANPLDLTGFAIQPPTVVEDLLEIFTGSGDVDAVVVAWWLGDEDQQRAEVLLEPLRNVAARTDVLQIMTTVEASRIGSWVDRSDTGVAFGRGLRGTLRALGALTQHVDHLKLPPSTSTKRSRAPLPTPHPIASAAGPMVGFADAMRLLEDHGVPTAPWIVVNGEATADVGALGAELVVKLADVPHRTDLNVVRTHVAPSHAARVIHDLRARAAALDVSDTIAVQAQASGEGEAFIGLRARTELGPVIVIGLGGILVELTRHVVGRRLPVGPADIDAMIDELGMFSAGVRGREPWNKDAFATAIAGVAELGQRAEPWLDSIDVNPLICDATACVAVDALLLMRPGDHHRATAPRGNPDSF